MPSIIPYHPFVMRLRRIPTSTRCFISVGSAALLVCLWFFGVYRPLARDCAQQRSLLYEQKTLLSVQHLQEKRIRKQQKEIALLEGEYKTLCVDPAFSPSALDTIIALARSCNLIIRTITPRQIERTPFYCAAPHTFLLEGTFKSIVSFCEKLSSVNLALDTVTTTITYHTKDHLLLSLDIIFFSPNQPS